MTEFLLPRTDRGVAWQAALATVILSGALYATRRDPELRLLVIGIAVLTASWFALRTLH
ncbi:MAG: hypothetical protein M3P34_01750 [Actinomycetota bacterium]|nr:hypothetical protein [Actinomycetota bacterium]